MCLPSEACDREYDEAVRHLTLPQFPIVSLPSPYYIRGIVSLAYLKSKRRCIPSTSTPLTLIKCKKVFTCRAPNERIGLLSNWSPPSFLSRTIVTSPASHGFRLSIFVGLTVGEEEILSLKRQYVFDLVEDARRQTAFASPLGFTGSVLGQIKNIFQQR